MSALSGIRINKLKLILSTRGWLVGQSDRFFCSYLATPDGGFLTLTHGVLLVFAL